jgi:hypothetical protein
MRGIQKGSLPMTQNADDMTVLLVLDPRLPGWGAEVAAAGEATVLVLDPARDGLAQVLEVLRERGPFGSVRVPDAGGAGRLALGTTVLDIPGLAERGAELAALGEGIEPDGTLVLGGGAGGASAVAGRFLAALARVIGRDVVGGLPAIAGAALAGGRMRDWQPGNIATLPGMPAAATAAAALAAGAWHQPRG